MYYRLREPWALRGYPDRLMVLDPAGETYAGADLSAALFFLLTDCDGRHDLDIQDDLKRRVLEAYIDQGVLEVSAEPAPIKPWQEYRFIENRRVPRAFFSITGRCNLSCKHCFMAAENNPNPAEFTLEQIKSILDQMDECGIHSLTVSGGEPLCHPHFNEIVKAITDHGMTIHRLYTNGILFTEKTAVMLEELGHKPELVFSFDGLGCHDWMRNRPGAEAHVVRALEIGRAHGFPLRCAVNVNSRSRPVLVETGRFLYEHGVRSLFFVRTSEAPEWLRTGAACLTGQEYWETALEVLRGLRDLNKIDLDIQFFNGPTIPGGADAGYFENVYLHNREEIGSCSAWCQKALTSPFISATGRVLPCDGFEGAALESHYAEDCNLLKRPLREILTDSFYANELNITVADIDKEEPGCLECPWVQRCRGGGCRACGMLWQAAQSGSSSFFEHAVLNMKLRGPLNCLFYRGGYYERMLDILRGEA